MTDEATNSTWFSSESMLLDELRRGRARPAPAPELPGFEPLVEHGRGGQGVVYVTTQRSTHRKVAIKLLLDAGADLPARRRFEREVDLVASLRHPRIVSVYDSGTAPDGRPYLVMEFVEGRALDEWLAAEAAPGQGTVRRVVELVAKVCDAVAFAHLRGVIHRDLKPGNIRVDGAGEPRVLDFGLAKPLVTDEHAVTVSAAGQFLGSLAWASPEQAGGDPAAIDVRTDVYSLGMLLYHGLTGTYPYRVAGPVREVLDQIVTAPPRPPTGAASWLDDEIETIVLKALSKEPGRRYQSAGELAADLRRYLAGEPVLAKADSAWYTLRAAVRRHRGAFAAAGVIVGLLIASSAALSWLVARERAAQRAAQAEAEEKTAVAAFLREMLGSPDPTVDGRDVKVVDVLDRAARRLESDQGLSAGVVASLRQTLGDTLSALGQYERAEAQMGALHEHRRASLGPLHPETLMARKTVAGLRAKQAHLEEAERIAREVVDGARSLSPAERARLAPHFSLGEVLYTRGRLAEAEAELRTALEVHYGAPDAAPEMLPQVLGSLAIVLRNQTRLAEAEPLFERALEAARQRLSPNSTVQVRLTNSYASLLHDQGKFGPAERAYGEALELAARTLGEDHDETMTVRSNLAQLFSDRGQHERAEPVQRQLMDSVARVYGPENPTTLTCLNNYAKTLQNLGRLEEAEPIMRRCAEARARVLGPEHPHTLIAESNLANMMSTRGDLAGALALESRVLETRLRTSGERKLDTMISLNNVGMLLNKTGDAGRGLEHVQRAAAAAAEVFGADHWYAGLFRGNVARCMIKLDRLAEAEPMIRSSLATLTEKLGSADGRTRQAAGTLAELLRATGREAEAAGIEPPAEK